MDQYDHYESRGLARKCGLLNRKPVVCLTCLLLMKSLIPYESICEKSVAYKDAVDPQNAQN